VYCLTDGEPVDFRDFVTELLETQGVDAPSLSIPRLVVQAAVTAGSIAGMLTGDRIPVLLGAQEYALIGHEMTVDDSLARWSIGYEPVISIDAGLAELRAQDW
jgi:nucleoside-diphosphate-sugar epimerase